MGSHNEWPGSIPAAHVYEIKKVIDFQCQETEMDASLNWISDKDWAILELDRDVNDREPLSLSAPQNKDMHCHFAYKALTQSFHKIEKLYCSYMLTRFNHSLLDWEETTSLI